MRIFFLTFLVIAQDIVHTTIFGNTGNLGYYYVDLWVGTPPVKQTVIIDTGSRLTAFPCEGCTDCGKHMDKYFDYKNSSTSQPVICNEEKKCYGCKKSGDSCHYSVAYAEGSSISGILMEDFIIFGDDFEHSHRVFMTFGCHRRETHLFRTQLADGIMGLGSGNGERPTVVELMFKDHDVSNLIFTICFAQDGGFMTVGGFNKSRHSQEARWTKMYETPYYGVVAFGMKVGGQDTGLEREDFSRAYETGSIVDSGTTFTYLCYRVYSTLFEFFNQFCKDDGKCLGERVRVSGEPHLCFVYERKKHISKENFFKSFPVVTVLFDEAEVNWKPERYLFAWPETPNTFCVGVYNNVGSGNVLGGIFMRGHDVIFDKGNSKIGFAQSECLYENNQNLTYIDESSYSPTEEILSAESSKRMYILITGATLVILIMIGIVLVCRKSRDSTFEILEYTPEPSVANIT
jgi:hypothetical protein